MIVSSLVQLAVRPGVKTFFKWKCQVFTSSDRDFNLYYSFALLESYTRLS